MINKRRLQQLLFWESLNSGGAPVSSYDVSAEALFNVWEGLLVPADSARKTMVNNVIVNLKSEGIWDELDMLYVWTSHNRTAALVDWKEPTRTATTFNDYVGDFTIDYGFNGTGNVGAFHILSGYNPGDGGTYNLTQDSASFGFHNIAYVDESRVDMSALNGSNGCEGLSGSQSSTGFSSFTSKVNCSTFGSNNNPTTTGTCASRRTASNLTTAYRNGYNLQDVSKPASTAASTPVENVEFNFFSRNNNGAFSSYSSKSQAFAFAGSGDFDQFTLHRIIDEFFLQPLDVTSDKRVMFIGNSITQQGLYTSVCLDTIGYNLDILKRGLNNYNTPSLTVDEETTVFPKVKTYLDKDVYFFWELTNHMVLVDSDVDTCYNALVDNLVDARAALGDDIIIIVPTCLPRTESSSFINANRQDDNNLTDNTTLNGRIRNHLVNDGYADVISDVASDPVMGIYSQGVTGVGELNLTYYADGTHPTDTGDTLLANTYFIPDLQTALA